MLGDKCHSTGAPVIFGHRGAGLDMPENTLSAFRLCRSRGADGIEIDVEFTSDEVAIILHDDTVDRTTDGTGEIGRISFSEARYGVVLVGVRIEANGGEGGVFFPSKSYTE